MSQDDLGSRESQRPPRRHRRAAWLAGLGGAAVLVLAVGVVAVNISPGQPQSSGNPATSPVPVSPSGSPEGPPSPTSGATPPWTGLSPADDALSLFLLGDHGVTNYSVAPQRIGLFTYQNSIRFTMAPSADAQSSFIAFNVAGHHFLGARIGIPNDPVSPGEAMVTVKFFRYGTNDQLGVSKVSVGRSQTIDLSLQGTTRLAIVCTATNSAGEPVPADVIFGGAILSLLD